MTSPDWGLQKAHGFLAVSSPGKPEPGNEKVLTREKLLLL